MRYALRVVRLDATPPPKLTLSVADRFAAFDGSLVDVEEGITSIRVSRLINPINLISPIDLELKAAVCLARQGVLTLCQIPTLTRPLWGNVCQFAAPMGSS